MTKLVTIYGGAGFLGRYIARRMAKEGWRVRVATRRPNDAIFVRPYGVVGQVEPVLCNVRDDNSVRAAMSGADVVVNCTGTFEKTGKNSFDAIHVDGADRIARIAAEEGISQMVHISAIGADAAGKSLYAKSKAKGEAAVLAHMPHAMILRPSVMFGPGDQFFNRFATMTRFGPILPVIGGNTKFQTVYVDDVAQATVKGILGQAEGGVYELGGPDAESFADLMKQMLKVIHRRRIVLNTPFPIAAVMGASFDLAKKLSLGLVPAMVTADQVKSLREDNVVAEGAKTFADLDIKPTATEVVLPEYLWRFRPSGQYDAIKESARNLRAH
jgi:NADH dehydrogenase